MTKGQNKHGVSQPKAKTLCPLKPTAHACIMITSFIILQESDYIIKSLEQFILALNYHYSELLNILHCAMHQLCHASTDPFRLPLFITVKYSTSYLYFRTQYAHKPLGEYEY